MDLNVKVFSKILAPVRGSLPVRASVAATEVARMVQLTHERPSFDVPVVNGSQDDSVVRDEVVTSTPFASLVHFVRSDVSPAARPKVLIVPGLAGHFATLVRGTISTMLQDHDVYVVDWHNARDVPVSAGRFGLDEYIEHLMTFLREIGPGTHLMGICQPAVACIVTAAIMAEDGDPAEPASLILLAGPVDTRVNPGPVNRSAGKQSMTLLKRTMLHTVPRGYVGAGRTVYPAFLQVSGFLSMDPRRHLRAFNGLFRDVKDGNEADARRTKEFYAEYFAMLDVAGEFFLETVRSVFKDNDLPRGNFYWRGRSGRDVLPGSDRGGPRDLLRYPGQPVAPSRAAGRRTLRCVRRLTLRDADLPEDPGIHRRRQRAACATGNRVRRPVTDDGGARRCRPARSVTISAPRWACPSG